MIIVCYLLRVLMLLHVNIVLMDRIYNNLILLWYMYLLLLMYIINVLRQPWLYKLFILYLLSSESKHIFTFQKLISWFCIKWNFCIHIFLCLSLIVLNRSLITLQIFFANYCIIRLILRKKILGIFTCLSIPFYFTLYIWVYLLSIF